MMMSQKKQTKIEDFTLLTVLGQGTYAKVILVKKKDNNQIYAMKVLKKSKLAKKKQQEHTMNERNVLVSVQHPFIVKLFYSFQNDRKLYFCLEYCPGGELFNLLAKQKRFTQDQARFFTAQMVAAIQHLHQRDIIYRDLKPENVMIDDTGYIRIADFGLSRVNLKDPTAKSICGTPQYLAPEILFQSGHGKPVDWWTIGSVVYQMITGTPAFQAVSKSQLFEKIQYHAFSMPPNISKNLRSFLELTLMKDPTQRLGYNGAQQVREHPWFTQIVWEDLLDKKIQPHFIPQVKNPTDSSNFDPEFTECEIESFSDPGSFGEKQYPDFSYDQDRISHGDTKSPDLMASPSPASPQMDASNNNQNINERFVLSGDIEKEEF